MNTESIKPNQKSTEGKNEQVEEMFDNISGRYDFLNSLISLGMDKRWKKNVLKLLIKKNPKSILDIATGTGDMVLLYEKTAAKKIVGIDISKKMLEIADVKIKDRNLQDRIKTEVQNSEALTYQDYSFEAITVSYGIRNFEDLNKGLSEIYRVLEQDGCMIIMETSTPKNKIIKSGYLFYTKYIMPRIARLFSKDKNAYRYLSDSAIHFPYGEELKKMIEGVGFKNVKLYPQFFGVTTIYYAEK